MNETSPFADLAAALAAALALNDEVEPPWETELRRAQRTAAFAADVLEAWGEQETHRGHRARHGLTAAHAEHARAVNVWSNYAADVAQWMRSEFNRESIQRLDQLGVEALGERELRALALRPIEPTFPLPLHPPRPWPSKPDAVGAAGVFFSDVAAMGGLVGS